MPLLQGLDFLMDRVPSLGIDAVLAKPVRMRTLIEVVNRLCGLPPRDAAPTSSRRTQLRSRTGGDQRRTPAVAAPSTLQDTAAMRRPR